MNEATELPKYIHADDRGICQAWLDSFTVGKYALSKYRSTLNDFYFCLEDKSILQCAEADIEQYAKEDLAYLAASTQEERKRVIKAYHTFALARIDGAIQNPEEECTQLGASPQTLRRVIAHGEAKEQARHASERYSH